MREPDLTGLQQVRAVTRAPTAYNLRKSHLLHLDPALTLAPEILGLNANVTLNPHPYLCPHPEPHLEQRHEGLLEGRREVREAQVPI